MVITIGRTYGSGGRYVGKLLAEKLGIGFYDDELLKLAAEESGFSEEAISEYDETPSSSLIYTLYTNSVASHVIPINQRLAFAQFDAIRKLADSESCVIIGRCADYVLKDREDIIRIFIYANMESRQQRLVKYYNVPAEFAEKTALKIDKKRAKYYEFYTGNKWGDIHSFDLCINSSFLGVEGTAELLYNFIQSRDA